MLPEAQTSPQTMRRPLQIAAIAIALAGLLVVRESVALKLYTAMGPGPGFFPLWLAIALIALAAAMFFQATFQAAEPMPEAFLPTSIGLIRILAVLAALVAVMLLLEPLGMRLTMFAFTALLPPLLGYRRPLIVLAIALAASFGVFEVFARVLDIPLPNGPWGL
jgi:putative tricarboxylic transport membrane protein